MRERETQRERVRERKKERGGEETSIGIYLLRIMCQALNLVSKGA